MTPARLGLGIDILHGAPGYIELAPSLDHRVKVHTGAPVPGRCQAESFVYSDGDLDIVPAGEVDGWYEDTASRSLMVSLSPALRTRAADELGVRAGLDKKNHFRDLQIALIAQALEAERTTGNLNGVLYAEGLGLALAVHLLGRYRGDERLQRGLSPLQRRRVAEYIEAHLDRDLRLTKLADLTQLRSTQFKALFRGSFGVPVHEYVVQRRVERAKQLLLAGELSISQVALEAGFAHPSHMARCMRRLLGVTPTGLRA
ncbi:MAG TPA: AraC family transcriptional regulator [Polyangiales bacterium]|nr:AraC family transcriptional regulator [Polyangiales bacterium]